MIYNIKDKTNNELVGEADLKFGVIYSNSVIVNSIEINSENREEVYKRFIKDLQNNLCSIQVFDTLDYKYNILIELGFTENKVEKCLEWKNTTE